MSLLEYRKWSSEYFSVTDNLLYYSLGLGNSSIINRFSIPDYHHLPYDINRQFVVHRITPKSYARCSPLVDEVWSVFYLNMEWFPVIIIDRGDY